MIPRARLQQLIEKWKGPSRIPGGQRAFACALELEDVIAALPEEAQPPPPQQDHGEFYIVSVNKGADGWIARFGDRSVQADEADDALRELCCQCLNADPAFQQAVREVCEAAPEVAQADAGRPADPDVFHALQTLVQELDVIGDPDLVDLKPARAALRKAAMFQAEQELRAEAVSPRPQESPK